MTPSRMATNVTLVACGCGCQQFYLNLHGDDHVIFAIAALGSDAAQVLSEVLAIEIARMNPAAVPGALH